MPTVSPELLRAKVAELMPRLVALRHSIHQEPEIAFQEVRTHAKIRAALGDCPLAYHAPLLGTDLIGDLAGASERRILLRADIDALPIQEESDKPYASRIPGMMHACGHDAHTTMLVGAALVLGQLREFLPVSVRFVWQPGEENAAGGEKLVAKGAADGCEAAFALHGWPGVPIGKASARPGAFFAAANFFEITVRGRGGHAALPEKAASPVPAAARIITALHDLHRRLNRESGSVVTVAQLAAGQASNIIPDTVTLTGTTRYLQLGYGEQIQRAMEDCIASALAGDSPEVTATMDYRHSYWLPVMNDPAKVAVLRDAATQALGPAGWIEAEAPTMGAEDFAFFLKDRPGAMFWLGVGETPGLHNCRYDFPDAALAAGVLMHCQTALGYPTT